ncbi:AAA family ATPase [Microbacterium sp. BLY]|uniref:AAA family ATPase n=1 Tax=Microbacterium sp. BLY TaxID=2823280 RepID=UPI001B323C71|nr:AAA family ATPase [Microbacterium sp. BLY]MBP3977849.1 AAA family ATPase [Microbacterium sp. BLY]
MSLLRPVDEFAADLAAWDHLLAGWRRTEATGPFLAAYRHPGQVEGTAGGLREHDGRLTLRARVDYAGLESGYDYTLEQARQRLSPTPAERAAIADADLEHELQRLRVRRDARRMLDAEESAETTIPAPTRLDAFLDEPDVDAEYRVDRLLPTGGNALFPAPAKAGKSTTIGNLARAFADGDAFLGTFAVQPARVVLIDNELDPRGLRRWLREQEIQHPEHVSVVPLRGRTASFDIIDPATRARWADVLRGADVLIFDCLRPVLDALGLDENRDAGQFLVALDALKTEAGISETVLVHHMGHAGERARGDSRLLGWPDVTWKITLERPDDPSMSPRFFSAFGRDVSVPETQLEYDPARRRMSVTGMSRRDAAVEVALAALIELLAANPNGLSQAAIEEALKGEGIPRSDVRQATHVAQQRALSVVVPGPRGAKVHVPIPHLATSPDLAATSPASTPVTSPPP